MKPRRVSRGSGDDRGTISFCDENNVCSVKDAIFHRSRIFERVAIARVLRARRFFLSNDTGYELWKM